MMLSKPGSLFLATMLAIGITSAAERSGSQTHPLCAPSAPMVQSPSDRIDPVLFKKIHPLFPGVRRERRGGEPFFSLVEEVARVSLDDGGERLVLHVAWIIPAARVDHGGGRLLVFESADDPKPIVSVPTFTIGENFEVIEDRWLKLENGCLVSLLDSGALEYFAKHGSQAVLSRLSRTAVSDALAIYARHGREGFLRRVSVPDHHDRWENRKRQVAVERLPESIKDYAVYPSLVEDIRPSCFKYTSPWEATILVHLIPDDGTEPVTLELGASGWAEGIDASEVDIVLWQTSSTEPPDRPSPEALARLR